MTTYFVTRHNGAKDWAIEEGFSDAVAVSHFDVEVVHPGDKVLGTLPVPLAAIVVARGGEYHHLTLDLPADARGKELTAADMRAYGARLEQFIIKLV